MAPKKDISGQTYGYLKAIRCTGDKKNGSFADKQEAIKARETAENQIFGDFLKWYNERKSKK